MGALKIITQEELDRVIENHNHWLFKDCDGWESMRANLNGYDLSGMNFKSASLGGANISYSLAYNTNFSDANLSTANLSGSKFTNSNFNGVCMSTANCVMADFSECRITNAFVRFTNFAEASFINSDLKSTNISRCCIQGAHMSGAKNLCYIPMVCPEEGGFFGWKVCYNSNHPVIVKLLIPSDAKRSSATTRKCRCDKAKVLDIIDFNGKNYKKAYSINKPAFEYNLNHFVFEPDFDENRWIECSKGIHFFMNRQEAIDYYNI